MNANRGAKITLYWLERSRAQRVMWLLEKLSLTYSIQTFKRSPLGIAPPELKKIHPMGKSPILTIEAPAATTEDPSPATAATASKPLVLAESAVIMEYLVDNFGGRDKGLEPAKYEKGREGQLGGETEAWRRYRYFMHFAEGSFMSVLQVALLFTALQKAPLPFFIKPIIGLISSRVNAEYLTQEFKTRFDFIEDQLASATPSGGSTGGFLCGGPAPTAADMQMLIALQTCRSISLYKPGEYPRIDAWVAALEGDEAYVRAVRKVEELEGRPFVPV